MKRAQFSARPVTYSILAIAALLILIFGASEITKWTSKSSDIEMFNFYNTLKNTITKQSRVSYGSVDEKIMALPAEIESVCFVDRSQNISPLVNCNLNYQINKYEDKNVFFEPFDVFTPLSIGNFRLNQDENPLCLKTMKGAVKLGLESKGNKTLVSTFRPSEKEVDCISVLYNSNPNNSIDIVFLPYGYKKFDDFRDDVNNNIGVFLSTEPFKSNINKMNFYRIEKFEDLGCQIGSWISCDEFEVKKLASFCPNDYIIVLADRSRLKDFINPIRSSAVSNMEKINTADNKLVILHEFGHIFGKLADEYVDEKYYLNVDFNADDYPNCDTPPECVEWKGVNGTGCFGGCSLNRYSRPTKNSMMRSLGTDQYGPLNENIITKKLNYYGGD